MIRARHVMLGVALGVLAVGCRAAEAQMPAAASTTASVAKPAAPESLVAQDSLVARDLGHVGVIIPSATIDLAPTYDGELDAVNVAVGQWVEAGTAIATFDPAAAREALAMARAEVRVAQGEAGQAAAMARHAGRRLAIERELVAQGISAAQEVDNAQADRARHGAASSSAAGRIAGAKARVEQLERQLEQMTLVAPIRGQVALVYREAGAQAGPSKPVVRLVDTSRSFVRFAVPAAEVAGFELGRAVEVIVDGPGEPLAATVREIAPEVDAPSGRVFVEAELAESSVARARPNSAAWVRLARAG